jgi:hypothetical protein
MRVVPTGSAAPGEGREQKRSSGWGGPSCQERFGNPIRGPVAHTPACTVKQASGNRCRDRWAADDHTKRWQCYLRRAIRERLQDVTFAHSFLLQFIQVLREQIADRVRGHELEQQYTRC